MGNYPHAGSMVASRKDVTSPRGNTWETRGRRLSTAYLSSDPFSKQPPSETKKLQRKDRRQSCPMQMSPPEQPTSIFPSTHTDHGRSSTSNSHQQQQQQQQQQAVYAHMNPARNTVCFPPSPLAMSTSSASQPTSLDITRPVSPLQYLAPVGPAPPPSAVLLEDLVRDRSPVSARRSMMPISSPNMSPVHSRQSSLGLPRVRPDRRSIITPAVLLPTAADRRHSSALPPTSGVVAAAAIPGGSSASSLVSAPGASGPVGQGRRDSYYQYGEDYITRYDRVGMAATPSPAPSLSRLSLVYNVDGGAGGSGAGGLPHHLPGHPSPSPSPSPSPLVGGSSSTRSRAGSRLTVETGTLSTWDSVSGCSWGDLGRDVERAGSERSGSGSGSAPSELMTEKSMMRGSRRDHHQQQQQQQEEEEEEKAARRRDRWVSWPRVLAFFLAVLVLAGIAVGIAFGVR